MWVSRALMSCSKAFQNPQTEYRHRRWRNLFNSWREKIGTQSTKIIPNCEELIRFWENVITRTKPRSDNALSHSWMQEAITMTVLHCVFQYEDFVLSRRSRLRIKAMVETFLKQGLVTQDRSRIRRWAGVFVLRQLVTAMFKKRMQLRSARLERCHLPVPVDYSVFRARLPPR
ncbi:unnamed protein product [Zymoseptoria tritici ST99CH_3D1]|nr:unnamed protein product [Zymoseptoria tritici ST99CH_3D1]